MASLVCNYQVLCFTAFFHNCIDKSLLWPKIVKLKTCSTTVKASLCGYFFLILFTYPEAIV